MYTIIKDNLNKYSNYKLCYIGEIPETYYDYTPEALAYRETEEWKEQDRLRDEKLHRQGFMSSDDPEFGFSVNEILRRGADCKNYPNPDYIEGVQEYYAYFTSLPLKDQWGDDWDDAPYEYNAGEPYDSLYEETDENGHWKDYEIVKVPFYLNFGGFSIMRPEDYVDNSPFSVSDINSGAVAWIYARAKNKECNGISIMAGINPEEFLNKLKEINNFLEWKQ